MWPPVGARIEPTTTEVPPVGRRPRRQTRESPRTHRLGCSCDSVRSGADLVPVPACIHVSGDLQFLVLATNIAPTLTGGPTKFHKYLGQSSPATWACVRCSQQE